MARRARPLLLVALLGAAAAGCVERKLWVRTDPPEAEVSLNGRPVGVSPVAIPFSFYGVVRVEATKSGYREAAARVDLDTPWYEIFPLDFLSENLLPFTLVDEHRALLRLEPVAPLETEADRERARREAGELRVRAERERQEQGGGPKR